MAPFGPNGLTTIAGLAVAALGAVAIWRLGRGWLAEAPTLHVRNYAGRDVPAAGGIVIVLTVVAVTAGAAWLRLAFGLPRIRLWLFDSPVVVLTLGFGLVGLIDDLLGDHGDKGFRGHVAALAHGRLSTGMVKLGIGAAVAAIALAPHTASAWWLLADAALVALGANLANLLDRAPGRVLKCSVIAGVPLLVLGWGSAEASATAPVLGAAWGILPLDLRERLMLGDAGANVVGAALGYLAVETSGRTTRLVLLAVVGAANLAAEKVSFSAVIDRVRPLRWIDRLGGLRPMRPSPESAG